MTVSRKSAAAPVAVTAKNGKINIVHPRGWFRTRAAIIVVFGEGTAFFCEIIVTEAKKRKQKDKFFFFDAKNYPLRDEGTRNGTKRDEFEKF